MRCNPELSLLTGDIRTWLQGVPHREQRKLLTPPPVSPNSDVVPRHSSGQRGVVAGVEGLSLSGGHRDET